MRECREVYRINPIVRLVGAGALIFTTYVFLYNAGVIPFALFERVGDASLSRPMSWVVYSLMWALGAAALWISANRITLTDQGMVYTAPLWKTVIHWNEVTGVALSSGPGFDVRSARRIIVVHCWYVHIHRLKEAVLKRVDPSLVQQRFG
jgi:hypothetical protein